MKMIYRTLGLLTITMTLSACGSLSVLAPTPSRPLYTGKDHVSTASAEQLLGIWSVTDLNPYPQSDPQTVTIEYRADGSVNSELFLEEGLTKQQSEHRLILTGQWSLNGDVLTHQNVKTQALGDSMEAHILSQMINSQKELSSQANIYELSHNRIVMLGDDGAAMEYLRQH